MDIQALPPLGAFLITTTKTVDCRGFFQRTYCQKTFAQHGITQTWVNTNISFNKIKKTTRGLHYQSAPFEEDKLITCLQGSLFDVMVDMRPTSPSYLQWFGIELSESNNKTLLIPKGYAHGYQTLADNTLMMYQVSNFYTPQHEYGALWNDPLISINWPHTSDIIISVKDQNWLPLTAIKE